MLKQPPHAQSPPQPDRNQQPPERQPELQLQNPVELAEEAHIVSSAGTTVVAATQSKAAWAVFAAGWIDDSSCCTAIQKLLRSSIDPGQSVVLTLDMPEVAANEAVDASDALMGALTNILRGIPSSVLILCCWELQVALRRKLEYMRDRESVFSGFSFGQLSTPGTPSRSLCLRDLFIFDST